LQERRGTQYTYTEKDETKMREELKNYNAVNQLDTRMTREEGVLGEGGKGVGLSNNGEEKGR
jgi:hypothetical protein